MASQSQIEANRRNAARSTGPKTATGKRLVAKNAVRHGLLSNEGLLFGESKAQFETLRSRLEAELAPVGQIEEIILSNIVWLAWRLERARRMEPGLQRWKCYEGLAEPGACEHRADLRSAATGMAAALTGRAPDDLPDDVKQQAAELADVEFAHALSAMAWSGSMEQIERYEARIERRLRKALKELETRQAARLRLNPSATRRAISRRAS